MIAQDQTEHKTGSIPSPLIVEPDGIPDVLKGLPQWVVWRYKVDPARPKPLKIPYQCHGGNATAAARTDDPATWAPFVDAWRAYDQEQVLGIAGIGFNLSPDDGIVGFDLDDCYTEAGDLEAWALDIIQRLDTYTERSPSGTGLHGYLFGRLPAGGNRKGHVEFYESGRYLTMTGDRLPDFPATVERRQSQLDQVHRAYFPPVDATPSPTPTKPNGTGDIWDAVMNPGGATGNGLSDADVIGLAANSDKATPWGMTKGERFIYLYSGMVDKVAHTLRDSSDSGADAALCNDLVYWCGGNRTQVDRLFRQSNLMRNKWDQDHGGLTYGDLTIDLAFQGRGPGDFYHGPGPNYYQAPSPSGTPTGGDAELAQLPLTDIGNGERLARRYGHVLRFVQGWDWLAFDGKRWAQNEAGAVQYGKAAVRAIYVEAATRHDADDRKRHSGWAVRSEAAPRLGAMLDLAKSEPEISDRIEDFDRAPMLLNVQNGTLDLEMGTLRPHDPADLLTRITGVSFNPNATCPRWETFIAEIMSGDADMIAYLQRAMGYSLTGLTQEQCLFFPYGTGSNGKSTLLETLIALLGDYATKTRTETLLTRQYDSGPNNDVAALAGARLVVAAEIPGNRHLNESVVKDLTGGDTITARFLRKEFFDFKPTFKLWMYGNHKPQITGTDDGIWRRLHLIPFTVQIPDKKKDRALTVKLLSELSGILNWILQGLDSWKVEGLNPPQKVVDATSDYRAEMDVLQAFLDECCMLDPTYWTAFADLYTVYKTWAATNGEKGESGRKFGRLLTDRGIQADKGTGNVSIRRGVGIRAAYVPPTP